MAVGIEGCGSYGAGLASFLRRHGHRVIEVNRPARKADRRARGKSDTIDAEHAAREVLAGTSTAIPKTAEGNVEALRVLKIARDTAVKARSQAMIALKATLVTATEDLRAGLEPLTNHALILTCAALVADELDDPSAAMRHVLGSLARRWLALHEGIKVHSRHLKELTTRTAPELVGAFGIGPDVAAELLVTAGDNASRIRSEAAFAKMCGVCPVLASSGKTNRHGLNRGGADVGHLNPREPGRLRRSELGVSVITPLPASGDRCGELLVGCATAQERPQIVAPRREEVGEELPVRRQPRPGAVATEGVG
jgi:transposase